MKLNLIILFFTLQSLNVFSQYTDEYGFDFELHNGTAILTPSWNNIYNIITMPEEVFKELMEFYSYKFIPAKDYWWKMSESEDSDFFIEKSKYELSFSFKNTKMETQGLEDRFEENFVRKSENGTKIYLNHKDQKPNFELGIWKHQNLGLVYFELKQ